MPHKFKYIGSTIKDYLAVKPGDIGNLVVIADMLPGVESTTIVVKKEDVPELIEALRLFLDSE